MYKEGNVKQAVALHLSKLHVSLVCLSVARANHPFEKEGAVKSSPPSLSLFCYSALLCSIPTLPRSQSVVNTHSSPAVLELAQIPSVRPYLL